ncbi:aromatic ring-hydroxylating dioxygenase subunit alpha [Nonomuraea wenchangensis]|uniref:Ring hydroxylating alpha subunit (Catalytic domain) n=1 Tax=Nonomuraea wenchangensis TaxID=568860 RepID=A0A1I0L1E6_9ACTN|nr:Rieske 2Fe-2S domain-containing protein [Nonomuraea wenchangensis]SEU32784.1 Ring hydroxylating alpha subunit (catalytic domain) [Nonomuraea wenchangensis]
MTSGEYRSEAFATPVDALLDRVEQSMRNDLVPAEIFNNEELFRAEMERVFTRVWVFVAHESEIPGAGDFVQRRIGVDPVIVTRDGEGDIHVLSNYCRHRGSQVCQTDSGNSRFFTCPYHGWTYANDGRLIGTPMMQRAYGEPLDPNLWSLKKAPKVQSYNGFVFASLSDDVPPLEEWLSGGASWMLDLILNLAPGGMRVAGPPERYIVHGDWKTAAENFAGDVYHLPTLHFSIQEVELIQSIQFTCDISGTYEFANGHTFIGHHWTEAIGPFFTYGGYGAVPGYVENFDLSGYDETQKWVAEHMPPTVGTIFPNLSFIRIFSPLPDGPPGVFTSFRQWQPIAPGKIELWNWQFVWNFQDEESARRDYVGGQYCFGSAGLFEQDDTVAWEGVQRAAASPWMRKEGLEFNYQQGQKSPLDLRPDPDWKGPGVHRKTTYGEYPQFNFLRQWLATMRENAPKGTSR